MRLGTVLQLSLGLAALAAALLLTADHALGLFPDHATVLKQTRQETSQNLAVLVTALVQERQDIALERTLQAVVARNSDVLSVALRRADGELVATTADHERYWIPPQHNRSTLTHVIVPVYDEGKRWGQVEVNYRALSQESLGAWLKYPAVQLALLLFTLGTAMFYLYLRRSLQKLNPAAAVPDRVRGALDMLTEGVLVIDRAHNVVLANQAFRRLRGDAAGELTGLHVRQLDWLIRALGEDAAKYPWALAMRERRAVTGTPILAQIQPDQQLQLSLNCMPVMNDLAQVQGCFLTFDDQTRTERTNRLLLETVAELDKARSELVGRNDELKRLADYDPLSDCLTRRSFFEQLQQRLPGLLQRGAMLSCLMIDIDHCKLINETHGHLTGDEVIRQLARYLRAGVGEDDLVCRFGGDEFCILLLGCAAEVAARIGERLRLAVRDNVGMAAVPTGQLRVTCSVGLASARAGDKAIDELIASADRALCAAKAGGRNQLEREVDRLAA